MKEEMFDELMESMKQSVAIRRGEMQPARVTTITEKADVYEEAARARQTPRDE